jgi:hypothetical protein
MSGPQQRKLKAGQIWRSVLQDREITDLGICGARIQSVTYRTSTRTKTIDYQSFIGWTSRRAATCDGVSSFRRKCRPIVGWGHAQAS